MPDAQAVIAVLLLFVLTAVANVQAATLYHVVKGAANIKTKTVAFGGILTSLCVIFIYLASAFGTAKISLVAASSLVIGVAVIKLNPKNAFLVYVAASIISLMLVPNKLMAVVFIVFLGNYPIVKLYIERIRKLLYEWVLKITLFNVYFFIIYFIWKSLFNNLDIALSIPVLLLVSNAVFIIYDKAFTIFINSIGTIIKKI